MGSGSGPFLRAGAGFGYCKEKKKIGPDKKRTLGGFAERPDSVAKSPRRSLFLVLSETILVFFSIATDFLRASTYSSDNKKRKKNCRNEEYKT